MDLENTGYFIDQCFADIAAGRVRPYYGMNFTARNARLPSHLAHAPLNILNGVYPILDRSEGINVPTFYLAGRIAFTEIHIEDGCLDSVNLIHWGVAVAAKLWMFIDPQYDVATTALIHKKLFNAANGRTTSVG